MSIPSFVVDNVFLAYENPIRPSTGEYVKVGMEVARYLCAGLCRGNVPMSALVQRSAKCAQNGIKYTPFFLRVLARMTSAGLTRHTQDIVVVVVVVIFLVPIQRRSVSPSHFSALNGPYHRHHYHQRSDNFPPAEIESCVEGVFAALFLPLHGALLFALRRFVCAGRRGRTRWLRCDRRAMG